MTRREPFGLNRTVQRRNPQQRIGEGGVHPGEAQRAAGEVFAARQHALSHQRSAFKPRHWR